jgi:hypothetical protein
MNEKDIIELYRNDVGRLNETPPESCWDEINTQLDLDETWASISIELNRVLPLNNDFNIVTQSKNQIILTRLITIVSPIVLILFLLFSDDRLATLNFQQLSGNKTKAEPIDLPATLQISKETPIISLPRDEERKIFPQVKSVYQPEQKKSRILLFNQLHVGKAVKIPIVTSALPNPEIGFTTVKSYPPDKTIGPSDRKYHIPSFPDTLIPSRPVFSPLIINPSFPSSLVTEPWNATGNESNQTGLLTSVTNFKRNRFSIGISLTEKNTWMISQETLEGLDKQKLNRTKAEFLNDIGVILRYTQSERWSFEGTGFLSSKTGQSYRQYMNGIYSSKSYELKYVSFEMTARHTFHRSLKINNVHFYSITGAYVSHLSSAYKQVDQTQFDVSIDYDPVDYGVIIGYEMEVVLFDRLAIAPGFRIKYGIPNIFADHPGIPDELHTTRNASLEFRLNLILPLSKY